MTSPLAPPDPRDASGRGGLLTEHIARQLEQRIRAGEHAVGSREVLRRLEATGLIEVAPGRGSFVVDRSRADARGYDALYRTERPTVRQLIEARIPLEVEIAGLAAERATDEQIEQIVHALD